MTLKPILSESEITANFAEIQRPMAAMEARVEANRCLNCFDAPCIQACPTGIDVPAFIQRIAEGRDVAAARLILEANILGASCARVCPTAVLCEGSCVLQDRDEKPIEIGRLQRHATDVALASGARLMTRATNTTGKRVAVVGSGPSGLGCAADLAQRGHAVTIFERADRPGGLNTYGIAYYKMTPEESLAEIARVAELGIEIRCGVEVGRDIAGAEVLRDFDAVFVGIGLGDGHRLGIEGEDLKGVVDALAFIREVHSRPLHEVGVGERVVVVGGGNTAIDAATQSVRLGAKEVTIAYRRSEREMTAYEFEQEIARADGVRTLFGVMPFAVIEREGRVAAVRLAEARAGASGRIEAVAGSHYDLPCDMLLKAVGQERQSEMLARIFPELSHGANGLPMHDSATGATNLATVFVGGDCANGGREVVNAVGEGKRAALAIHAFLTGETVATPLQPSRLGAARARGAGLERPIRAHEAEAAWRSVGRSVPRG